MTHSKTNLQCSQAKSQGIHIIINKYFKLKSVSINVNVTVLFILISHDLFYLVPT